VKRRNWILLAVLVLAMFLLSGCGVPHEGVDVLHTQPEGPWQQFVVWPLANILISISNFLENLGIVYYWGWAIIVFTFIVKLITFPLTLQQTRGMQAQKDLQPKLQELQKKYGKDREKLAAEQMKLYQEAGVNPLSGCLPLLIQMPILFGLYAALIAVGPMLKNAGFFWIPDLSYPQYSMGLNWITTLWNNGDYVTLISYLILPVLLVVTQFVMQKWMTPTPATGSDDSSAKMTQNMSMVMTLFFGFFTLQVPAGLTLYWVTSNLLQMLQQWSVTRFFLNKSPTPATAAAGTAAAAPVVVDGKATKVTASGASKSTPSSAGANGGGAAPRPAAGTKASKPANRPKAKGK
jgi:YidC/Oxa1 family membrane protein insertase